MSASVIERTSQGHETRASRNTSLNRHRILVLLLLFGLGDHCPASHDCAAGEFDAERVHPRQAAAEAPASHASLPETRSARSLSEATCRPANVTWLPYL